MATSIDVTPMIVESIVSQPHCGGKHVDRGETMVAMDGQIYQPSMAGDVVALPATDVISILMHLLIPDRRSQTCIKYEFKSPLEKHR